MPMYEYACASCGRTFEELVRSAGEAESPACPHCKSRKTERRVSVFAARSGGSTDPAPMGGGCGRCGDPTGPCGMPG